MSLQLTCAEWAPLPEDLPDWRAALTHGAEVELADGRPVTVRCAAVGELGAPTGHIVGCDPLVVPNTEPLPLQVPPGSYPVFVSEVDVEGEPFTLATALVFSAEPPVRWTRTPYHDVDSGLFGLFDKSSAEAVGEGLEQHLAGVHSRLDGSPMGWVVYPVSDGHQLALGYAGFGDGAYLGYVGWAADDTPSVVVIGFGFLQNDEVGEEDEAATVPLTAADQASSYVWPVEHLLRHLYTFEGPVTAHDALHPEVTLEWDGQALAQGIEPVLEALRARTFGGLDLEPTEDGAGQVTGRISDRASGDGLGQVTVGYSDDTGLLTGLAFRWEQQPEGAVIPDVSRLTEAEATARLHLEGFTRVSPATIEFDAPPEMVVGSCPPAGVRWAHAGEVEVVLARPRTEEVEVPDLSGLPEEVAREQVETLGLFLTVSAERTYDGELEPDHVVGQRPEAGATRPTGTGVEVTLTADTRIELLDLVGCDLDEALMRLDILGLKQGRVKKVKEAGPSGTVVETTPPAGSKLSRGSKVALVVAG